MIESRFAKRVHVRSHEHGVIKDYTYISGMFGWLNNICSTVEQRVGDLWAVFGEEKQSVQMK